MSAAHQRPSALAISTGLLALLLVLPLVVVLTAPLHAGATEWDHVLRHILPAYTLETMLLLGGTLLAGLIIAVPTAWFIAACDFPGRRMFRWLFVLPLALPTYISAYAYAGLLGPTGTLSSLLNSSFGIRPDIVGLPGLCVVLAMALSPYIHLPARAAFTQGMRRPLDAARMLGGSPWRRFRMIALPLARPAIAGGALLMAMETLNDYGAVKYYGIRTLTTGIFRSWGGLYDLGSALRLSMALLGLIAVLMWIERRAHHRIPVTTDQVPVQPTRVTGTRGWLISLWCTVIVLFSFGLPIGSILIDVWRTRELYSLTDILPIMGNTMLVASLAAACTLFIGIVLTFRERYGKGKQQLIGLANFGYAMPGAVIAISVMALAGAIDRADLLGVALIGSIGLLTYAFTVRFLAVAMQPMAGNLLQQPRALDDAARLLGASPWRSFTRVNLPLLRPALLAAALLVSIDVIKELPLTLILRPFNFHTLSTRTYELASIEQLAQASWPALVIVMCGLVPVFLLERLLSRSR